MIFGTFEVDFYGKALNNNILPVEDNCLNELSLEKLSLILTGLMS